LPSLAAVQENRKNNFVRKTNSKAYDHYDFSSVMHYGEFAFRNKEWGALSAQFTRWCQQKHLRSAC
jgi:hypothetical protein